MQSVQAVCVTEIWVIVIFEILHQFNFLGYLFGNDVLRLFHGNDECLTIPENWSEYNHKFVFAIFNK